MGKCTGEAGVRGSGVRSDCWIGVELKDSGGPEIEVTSRVGRLFGEAIRTQLERGLTILGVEHARVQIEDGGCLPFAIDARLEAAVRAADPGLAVELLPEVPVELAPSPRDRFRRSRLYLPGNTPKLMVNAGLHGADAVILDLEDSVAPVAKDAARCVVRNAMLGLDFQGAEIMVRINQGARGLHDLDFLVPHGVQLILVPKVEGPEELVAIDERIAAISARVGRTEPVWLMPIIESARGTLRALEIASGSPNNVALALGLEDYTADIGVQRTNEGTESIWMRSMVVNAARAAGLQPIDTVFSDVADSEGLRASVLEAKALGFDGKGCIHPRQVGIVNEAFAPTDVEVGKAKRIVLAFDEATRKGLGVVSLGSKMIDPPVVKRALHTVKLAMACGLLDEQWRDEA